MDESGEAEKVKRGTEKGQGGGAIKDELKQRRTGGGEVRGSCEVCNGVVTQGEETMDGWIMDNQVAQGKRSRHLKKLVTVKTLETEQMVKKVKAHKKWRCQKSQILS